MSKKEAFAALDKTLENDFDEIPSITTPMVIPQTVVPANIDEDKEVVRKGLYDVSTKLGACFDFLVNNFQDQMSAPGIIKSSPTSDVVELAKAIVYVNQKILSVNDDKGGKGNNPKSETKSETNTQYNTVITDSNGLTTAVIDQMIKEAVKNSINKPININNNN